MMTSDDDDDDDDDEDDEDCRENSLLEGWHSLPRFMRMRVFFVCRYLLSAVCVPPPPLHTRSAVLEIFNRVPWSQIPLDEPVYQTLDTCLHILENDNEENAISAVKVLGELYRTHRTSRGSLHVYAERFLDCVVRYYSSFVSIVEETLGTNVSSLLLHRRLFLVPAAWQVEHDSVGETAYPWMGM